MKKIVFTLVFASILAPALVSAQLILNTSYGLPSGSIYMIVSNLLRWLLGILGVVGIIAFVISGIMYLVSTGDDTMITRAKSAMMWSIVGMIVGLAGFVIIQAAFMFLTGVNNQF